MGRKSKKSRKQAKAKNKQKQQTTKRTAQSSTKQAQSPPNAELWSDEPVVAPATAVASSSSNSNAQASTAEVGTSTASAAPTHAKPGSQFAAPSASSPTKPAEHLENATPTAKITSTDEKAEDLTTTPAREKCVQDEVEHGANAAAEAERDLSQSLYAKEEPQSMRGQNVAAEAASMAQSQQEGKISEIAPPSTTEKTVSASFTTSKDGTEEPSIAQSVENEDVACVSPASAPATDHLASIKQTSLEVKTNAEAAQSILASASPVTTSHGTQANDSVLTQHGSATSVDMTHTDSTGSVSHSELDAGAVTTTAELAVSAQASPSPSINVSLSKQRDRTAVTPVTSPVTPVGPGFAAERKSTPAKGNMHDASAARETDQIAAAIAESGADQDDVTIEELEAEVAELLSDSEVEENISVHESDTESKQIEQSLSTLRKRPATQLRPQSASHVSLNVRRTQMTSGTPTSPGIEERKANAGVATSHIANSPTYTPFSSDDLSEEDQIRRYTLALNAAYELKKTRALDSIECAVLKDLIFLDDERVIAALELFEADHDTADMLDTLLRIARFEARNA